MAELPTSASKYRNIPTAEMRIQLGTTVKSFLDMRALEFSDWEAKFTLGMSHWLQSGRSLTDGQARKLHEVIERVQERVGLKSRRRGWTGTIPSGGRNVAGRLFSYPSSSPPRQEQEVSRPIRLRKGGSS